MFGPTRVRKLHALIVFAFILAMSLTGCEAAAVPAAPAATDSPTIAPAATAEPTMTPEPAVATAPAQPAVDLSGAYTGVIEIAGQKIEIKARFEPTDDGYAAELDIPAQGAFGIPVDQLTIEGSEISFTILSGASLGVFAGEVDDEGNMQGTFVQVGYTGTFTLQPAVAEDLPYRREEVTFGHDDISLAGTLSLPEGDGPFPAVILVSGSGAQDRDENVSGFRVFFELADYLTRNGIAVLRYDDRGIGGSTGDLTVATTPDLAEDVSAAVDLLLARDDIDHEAVGLIGHSEGGLVAPLTADRNEGVSFIVLMAGPGTTGEQVLKDQLVLILRAQGATDEDIALAQEQQEQTLAAIRTGEGWDEIIARSEAELRAAVDALTEEQKEALGDIDAFVESSVAAQVAGINNPWFRAFVDYDPVPVLLELKVPVLALFGTLDLQVPADGNATAMEEALKQAGVAYRIEIVPDANHLFQKAVTGSIDEYGQLEPAFVPGFLDLVLDWISTHIE